MNDVQPSQILRSHQKDVHHKAYLRSLMIDFINSLPGMKMWLKWTKEIDIGSDLVYYGLTTIAGYQTLGEEYSNILQISFDRKGIPSKYRRALMVALEILVPYMLDKLASILACRLRNGGTLFGLPKIRIADFVDSTRNIINFLHKYHLVLFYTSGLFFSFAKRLLGISYAQVRATHGGRNSKHTHILGMLMLLQLIISALHRFYKVWSFTCETGRSNPWAIIKNFVLYSDEYKEHDSKVCTRNSSGPDDSCSLQSCSLCQESITNITSTMCGHLFCWKCIVDWCENKLQCPVCRAEVVPSKLIRLQNHV